MRDQLAAQQASAQFTALLEEEQTVDRLFDTITGAIRARPSAEDVAALDPLMSELAGVITARLAGEPRAMSWLRVSSGDVLDRRSEPPLVQKLLYVQPVLDFAALQPAQAALDAIDEEIASLNPLLLRGVELGVTGEPALRTEELRSVSSGIEFSFLISFVLVSFLLLFAFLSVLRAALCIAVLLSALIITAGLAGLLVGDLNLVSVAFTVLLVGLGLDFAIHFLAHTEDAGGHISVVDALNETCHSLGAPLALTVITTALAFLSFVVTDFVGMGQLGIIGAMGVVVSFLVAITLIPALLALNPRLLLVPRQERVQSDRHWYGSLRVQLAFAGVVLVAAAAATPFALQVRFDTDPMQLRDPNAPAMQAVNWLIEEPEFSPYRVSVIAESEADAEALADRLAELPEVSQVTWLGDFVAQDQPVKLRQITLARVQSNRGNDDALSGAASDGPAAVPRRRPSVEEREAAAAIGADSVANLIAAIERSELTEASVALKEALETYQSEKTTEGQFALQRNVFAFFDTLLERRDQADQVEAYLQDDLPSPLRARYIADNGWYRVDVAPAGDMADTDEMQAFVDALASVDGIVAGGASDVLKSGAVVSNAMLTATALALALVTLVALVTLRSVPLVIAIILPLFVGGLFTAAASVLFELPFNYANVIVLPLLIGLGVDSGVHLAMRGDRLRSGEAIFGTSTPRAIVFSALTTVAAFGSLSLNDHRGTASMGLMLTIALVCCIVSVLALTPPLVALARRLRGV